MGSVGKPEGKEECVSPLSSPPSQKAHKFACQWGRRMSRRRREDNFLGRIGTRERGMGDTPASLI